MYNWKVLLIALLFYKALKCNHPVVMYEVILSIQRLVNKYGTELWDPTWSIILDIIEEVISHTGKIKICKF